MAGPATMAACEPVDAKASARGSKAGGTSSGGSDCCAGIWNALTTPSSTEVPSSRSRLAQPRSVASASTNVMSTCAAMHSAMMRPR